MYLPARCFKALTNAWSLVALGLLLGLLLYCLRPWLEPLLLIYAGALALVGLVLLAIIAAALVQRACRKRVRAPKGYGSIGHPGVTGKTIPSHTHKRPDPMIYSQSYLLGHGLGVTWDNPDIHLERSAKNPGIPPGLVGTVIPSNELEPATWYDVVVQLWNGSLDAPAVNVLVRFYYLSFGIGTARHGIDATCLVDVPVKGAAGLPALGRIAWQTPSVPGHYCLQAEIVWPDDAEPTNNLGQENVDVKKLNSPHAKFTFPVRNDTQFVQAIRMEADTYAIPPLPPCDAAAADREARSSPIARHRRGLHPVPDTWRVEITPPGTPELAPGDTMMVTVDITAPDGPIARQPINVNAFSGDHLLGGVTLYVHS